MNLSEALIKTLFNHDADALLVILQQLPATALRADEGAPCLLEMLLKFDPPYPGYALPQEQRQALQKPIAGLFTWAFQERAQPSPALCERLVQGVLDKNEDNATLVQAVWDLAGAQTPVESRLGLLKKALEKNWDHVVRGLLDVGCPTDLSTVPAPHNPFSLVRSLAMLNALVDAGFDATQKDAHGYAGLYYLRQRSSAGFENGNERDAIARRVPELSQGLDLPVQLNMGLLHAQKWSDLQATLKAMGPKWLDLRLGKNGQGGTAFHSILFHHPEWLDHLLARRDVRNRLDVWNTLNEHGEHALMVPWFRMNKSSMEKWMTTLAAHPIGGSILATLPVLPTPDGALRLFMDGAARRHQALPDFTGSAFWDFQQRMGGWRSDQAKTALLNDPAWQVLFERVVWNPVRESLDSNLDWSCVSDWAGKTSLPWILNFRLLEASRCLYSPSFLKESPTLQDTHRRAVERCQSLLEVGASWSWATEKIQAGKSKMANPDEWTVLGVAWETRQLTTTLQDVVESSPQPRARRRM